MHTKPINRFWNRQSESTKIMWVALAAVLVRSPLLLAHGRVFAEEGTLYLQQAWDADPLDTLLAIREGYYSLLMNVASLLAAKVLPLEWVARSYTLFALGILLLTVYLVVISEAFPSFRMRALAASLILLTPSIEVWLTLLDAQFYLSVCVGLICISSEHRHRLVRCSTLLVAGLTGPPSCVFAPFFVWKAYRSRSTNAWIQAVIICICSAIQCVILLQSIHSGKRAFSLGDKARWFGPIIFVKVFSVTLFTRLGSLVSQHILATAPSRTVCLCFWFFALGSLTLFWRVVREGGRPGKTLFAMAVTSFIFNYVGDPAPVVVIFTGEYRYFFTGMVFLWLSLLLGCARLKIVGDLRSRQLANVVVGIMLIAGLVDAVGYWTRFQRLEPRWSEQISAWKSDPSEPIRVPPQTWNASIHISPHSSH